MSSFKDASNLLNKIFEKGFYFKNPLTLKFAISKKFIQFKHKAKLLGSFLNPGAFRFKTKFLQKTHTSNISVMNKNNKIQLRIKCLRRIGKSMENLENEIKVNYFPYQPVSTHFFGMKEKSRINPILLNLINNLKSTIKFAINQSGKQQFHSCFKLSANMLQNYLGLQYSFMNVNNNNYFNPR